MCSLLLVEPDSHQRLLLSEEFGEEGYDVRTAASAREALARLYAGRPDLVVLDPDMTGTEGTQLLGRLLGIKRHLPVVIYTAYSGSQENFRSWAADAHVLKRSDLGELKERIREVLEKRGARPGCPPARLPLPGA